MQNLRQRLVDAAKRNVEQGIPTHVARLDPNEKNVRIFNVIDINPAFAELITHPSALSLVRHLLADDFLVSDVNANIAQPGSGSMVIHSDLAVVLPPPWTQPWSINVIWCLDNVREENGATRYLPGSHKFQTMNELPEDMAQEMMPLEAKAGSILAMDGRLWHTSGENRTLDEERALLFAYYTRSFIQQRCDFEVELSDATKATLSPELKKWLGLESLADAARTLS
ncbi:phytanoyl-CoA dioxygenase family protein [Myxococcota bacterium]|nr:phytanoyl-CoA dioxygenase family protein [Myxococcota bacterium]